MDFAGGIAIHVTSGVAALVVAVYIERRNNIAGDPHNLIFTFIGCSLIWVGWFCFNGGSALAANKQASQALMNTQLAACTGLVVSLFLG